MCCPLLSLNTCFFQFLKELLSIWIISINKFYYKLRLTLVFVWLNSNFVPYLRVWLKNLVSFLVDYKVALFQCTFCEKLRRTFRLLQFFQIVGHTKLFKPKNLKKKAHSCGLFITSWGWEGWSSAELGFGWRNPKKGVNKSWTNFEHFINKTWKNSEQVGNKSWRSHEKEGIIYFELFLQLTSHILIMND